MTILSLLPVPACIWRCREARGVYLNLYTLHPIRNARVTSSCQPLPNHRRGSVARTVLRLETELVDRRHQEGHVQDSRAEQIVRFDLAFAEEKPQEDDAGGEGEHRGENVNEVQFPAREQEAQRDR